MDPKKSEWHEVYDALQSFPRAPYRFVDHKLTPITSEQEQAEAAHAAAHEGKYALAAEHVGKALAHFGARPTPDYENAAKEAASAVESALAIANGEEQPSVLQIADGLAGL